MTNKHEHFKSETTLFNAVFLSQLNQESK